MSRVLSRTRVFWGVLFLLGGLDAARSWNGHRAYRSPASRWQPERAVAVNMSWPPGAGAATNSLGERVFLQRCAVCHGPEGQGNGPAAASLRPRPRDFTTGELKFRSTAAGSPLSTEDVLRTVRDGLSATAMPGFGDLLGAEELQAVSRHVLKLAGASGPVVAVAVDDSARLAASADRGRSLYAAKGCPACHGDDGHLRRAFDEYGVVSPDLTQPWTFHSGARAADIYLRLSTGILPGPMPSYAEAATVAERWDIAQYVASMGRPAPWEAGGALSGLGQSPDLVRRGEYLSRAEICGLCHTQINATGIYREELRLAGGMSVEAHPHSVQVSRNLTSDPETGVGGKSEDALMQILQLGHEPDRQLSLWGMPWPVFYRFKPDDARALARYLLQTTPQKRPIPDLVHDGFIETLAMKIARGLPASPPKRLIYRDGDFANLPSLQPLERALIDAQWIVLVVGVLAWLFAAEPGKRWPRTARSRVKWALLSLGLLVGGAVAAVVVQMPTMKEIPPEVLSDAILGGLPQSEPPDLPKEHQALYQRGRYLYQVASCAFCHGGDGRGGAKISWRPFGTLYVRNISSDPVNGIGNWNDAQIARAIRSGISGNGRALHWQGMPWDLFSNFEEEDIRALVTFLRHLPAVPEAVPPPRAPDPTDCAEYSFFVARGEPPGCGD